MSSVVQHFRLNIGVISYRDIYGVQNTSIVRLTIDLYLRQTRSRPSLLTISGFWNCVCSSLLCDFLYLSVSPLKIGLYIFSKNFLSNTASLGSSMFLSEQDANRAGATNCAQNTLAGLFILYIFLSF